MDKLRILVCGGRHFNEYGILKLILNEYVLENHLESSQIEIVSGHCIGADLLGERWAREFNAQVKRFPAEWEKFGKRAGPLRNKKMVEYINNFDKKMVIAFISEDTFGTLNTVQLAEKEGIPVIKVFYEHSSIPVHYYLDYNYDKYDVDLEEIAFDDIIIKINCINVKIPLNNQIVDYYKYKIDDNFLKSMAIEDYFNRFGKDNNTLVEMIERCCENFYSRLGNTTFPLKYVVAKDREELTQFSKVVYSILEKYIKTKNIEEVAPNDRNLVIVGDYADDNFSFQNIINMRLFFKNIAIFKIDKE